MYSDVHAQDLYFCSYFAFSFLFCLLQYDTHWSENLKFSKVLIIKLLKCLLGKNYNFYIFFTVNCFFSAVDFLLFYH